ncbi:hypothetical protein UO65_3388 [Actinokineospora spheciospongiae]|uniref:Orc1-like AAA ATPase domain-containing protein n=1 Tax=Actinokineospora spheciospongiae TaxID=909613 RepID=W7IWZ5_9PSEU|nr:hypothetical protein UO65_3388 [Actinokineospora spheciospongiae]
MTRRPPVPPPADPATHRAHELAASLRRLVAQPWPREDSSTGPGLLTALVVEFGAGDPGVAVRVNDIALRFGGQDLAVPRVGDKRVLSALFPSVCDATRAALEIASMVVVATSTARAPVAPAVSMPAVPTPAVPTSAVPMAAVRVVLCTAADSGDTAPGTAALRHAGALLPRAAAGQILTTAPTAMVAGPTLPAGIDLLARDLWTPVEGGPAERVYELRVGTQAVDGLGTSNLDWARRAVHAGVTPPGVDGVMSAWTPVRANTARLVLISGGDGASRIAVAAEAALRLHAAGALVLHGRWSSGSSWGAFREALGTYADGVETRRLAADLEGWADEIYRVLPEVGARVGGRTMTRTTGDPDRSGVVEALCAWIGALTRRTPTVLVLADAHRADPASVALLSQLWHALRGQPLMVVATTEGTRHPVTDRVVDVVTHPDPAALVRVQLA